jgi:undecaprenyl-diphosphatase
MSLKTWLLLEKQDLDKRIRSYSRFRLLLLASIILGFFVSVFWLWQKTFSLKVKEFDNTVMVWISQLPITDLRKFFSLVTQLGSGFWIGAMFIILAVLLVSRKRKRAAAVVGFTLAGSAFFIFFLKDFFGRSRPFGCLPPGDCLAFPSGHATISFYFYGLLDYLIFRFLPISLKTFLIVSFFIGILILLIALSRLFLGFHYPSDLLAGFFLGGTWLLLAVFLIDILY